MKKKDLRINAKEIRLNIDIVPASVKIVERIKNLSEYKCAQNVLFFYPKEYEIDLLTLCSDDKNFYLPKIDGQNLLICPYDCGVEVQLSEFKTLEPCTNPISPRKIDLAIIPCLMADKRGYRLGYGGGFYDRLIPQLRKDCVKIVPVLSELLIEELPIEEFDKPVDIIVCPDYCLFANTFS